MFDLIFLLWIILKMIFCQFEYQNTSINELKMNLESKIAFFNSSLFLFTFVDCCRTYSQFLPCSCSINYCYAWLYLEWNSIYRQWEWNTKKQIFHTLQHKQKIHMISKIAHVYIITRTNLDESHFIIYDSSVQNISLFSSDSYIIVLNIFDKFPVQKREISS